MKRHPLAKLLLLLIVAMLAARATASTYEVQQSTTSYPLVFLMIDSSDHVSGKTGLTPTVTLSKNGGSFASPAGAVSEIGSGWYKVAGNATDTATLGPLVLHATSAGADALDTMFNVVAYNPQDSVRLGLTALPNASAGANGGLPTGDGNGRVAVQSGTSAGQISLSSGTVTVGTNSDKTGYTVSTVSDKTGYSLTQTFPSNFSALAIASNGHISNVDTLTTYTGNTPQTGDAFARIGANGVGLTAVGDTAGTTTLLTRLPSALTLSGGKVQLDLTQAVPTSNTSETVGDALNGARAQAFGKWVISGTTLTMYAADGTTVVRTFTLNSATAPTSRQ